MPKISVMKENETVMEWTLDDKEVLIGRGDDCHITLKDPLISWNHAKIVKAYGGYLIEDLRSTNGVTINGRRITKQMLKYGDKAKVGAYDLCFNKSIDDKYNEPEKTVLAESAATSSLSSSLNSSFSGSSSSSFSQKTGKRACIRFLTGPDSGISKPIGTSLLTIGKAGTDSAVITCRGDNYFLQHLSGKRSTVNGNSVSSSGSQLKDGDKIQVGEDEMRFLIE